MIAGIWVLLAGVTNAADINRQVTIEQFQSEAPRAWQDLRAGLLEGFKVDVTMSRGTAVPGHARVNVNVAIGFRHERTLCISVPNELIRTRYVKGKRRGESVTVVNDRYGFDLSRKNGEDSNWLVTNLYGDPAAAKNSRSDLLSANTLAFDSIRVESEWLTTLLKSPGFEVLSGKVVTGKDGTRQFEVDFRSHHVVDPVSMPDAIVGGTFWFLPDRYWVLNGYDVRMKSGTTATYGTARARMAYQQLDSFPFLRSIVLDYEFAGESPLRYYYEFGDVSRCSDDSSAFSLIAFGFPELSTSDTSAPIAAYKWWLAVSSIGVVFCITAIVLRNYARR